MSNARLRRLEAAAAHTTGTPISDSERQEQIRHLLHIALAEKQRRLDYFAEHGVEFVPVPTTDGRDHFREVMEFCERLRNAR